MPDRADQARRAHAVLLATATQLAAELHALQQAATELEAAHASAAEYGRLQARFAAWRARLAAMREQMWAPGDVRKASDEAAS